MGILSDLGLKSHCMFKLDSRLLNDTVEIGRLPLSLVLLSKDSNYPWCILVPRREGIQEIHHLSLEDSLQLIKESCLLSDLMEKNFKPDKINVAALGNIVPQLHLHHVARYTSDAAWPGPIWGKVEAAEYEESSLEERVAMLRVALGDSGEKFISE